MVRTDIIGGVHAQAIEWLEADNQLIEAEKILARATEEVRSARGRKENAALKLVERTGRNITLRAFHIGNEVVLVEYERGVKRIAFEDTEK